MEDLRSGIEHLKQAKAHMSEANGIMSDHISKLKALEKENAELRAKLEAWIQSDDSYMKLPLDAERALPEVVEWPRFEDGELVKVGDEVEYKGETMRVYLATFDAAGWALWCSREGIDSRFSGSYGERVKRPTHKVLDADGVPIEVGDTVWATYDGSKHIVTAVCSDGSLHPEMFTDDGCMVEYGGGLWDFAKKVTHEQPDSWILWGEDLDMAVKVGEVDKVEMARRAKALAKADSEARGVE